MKNMLIGLLVLGTATASFAQSNPDISFIKSGTYKAIDVDKTAFSGKPDYLDTSCDRHVEVDETGARIYMSTVDKGNGKCKMQQSHAYTCLAKDGLTTCKADYATENVESNDIRTYSYVTLETLTLIPDGAIYIEERGVSHSYFGQFNPNRISPVVSVRSSTKFVRIKDQGLN